MKTLRRRTIHVTLGLMSVVASLRPTMLAARDLIEPGGATLWKYFDHGKEPPAAWRKPGFDDSKWGAGAAPLGYGEDRVATQVHMGSDGGPQAITTWFRHEFSAPQLKPSEQLVLALCVDDGAVVYLNGNEIGRTNMPAGAVKADTLASRTLPNDKEGFYTRLRVPTQSLKPGMKNVLAVEVHQAAAKSSDLFFDLALKTLPLDTPEPQLTPATAEVVKLFNAKHYIGPGVKVPDGYIDGGRGMKVNSAGSASSGREILMVDRGHDASLADDLAFARSSELRMLPELERIQRIAACIDAETTPPGGRQWVGETVTQLEDEFTSKPVMIGDWVNQCQAGVCRHRALLFKILADEAGLKAALVRGNFAKNGPPGGAHAWNEVQLSDGTRVLVDVMHNGGNPKFPPLNDPIVVARYLRVDDTPWYSTGN
ncbi:MAG TPA: EDR1-related protein [Pirellulales bacterium]|jgi:hypothetical protein|nr:EDR1-related protein [Pirellulales bacterium]